MSERIHAFDRDGRVLAVEERTLLNQQIREYSIRHGDANVAVECVYLMLVNSSGAFYIVQRADKAENPWLWDKTVGGGVTAGDTPDQTVVREAAEELGIVTVLVSVTEHTALSAQTDTRQHAIVRQIAFDPWFRSERVAADGARWVKRHRTTLYAGRYDGDVRFADGEANAVALMTLAELRAALDARPHDFTDDLR